MRMRGDGRKAKDPKKTLTRLLGYMKKYVPILLIVFACIVMTSIAQTTGNAALGTLVDEHILPMVSNSSEDFSGVLSFIGQIALIFVLGMVANFFQSYLMVGVAQGTQKRVRDEMFTKMQRLPLRYFDSNTAGNIMSRYTGDIDTLNQMLGQSIPQCASSIVTPVCTSSLCVWFCKYFEASKPVTTPRERHTLTRTVSG